MIRALIIILFLLWATPGWCAYSYYRTITVAHGQVSSSSQTQFPILVCGNGSGVCNASVSGLNQTGAGAHVQNSNGYDIIFTTDSGCANNLTWEMENYNASTGEFEVWVTNTSTPLSNTVDTVFYMCYGNAAISTFQSTASAVWDSNYKGVWHLPNGTVLTVLDSTTNANNGTKNNTPTAITGQIDGGAGFATGSSNYVSTANIVNITTSTISAWVNIPSLPATTGSIAGFVQNNGTGTADKDLSISTTGKLNYFIYDGANKTSTSTASISTNTWHYLVGTQDGSTVKTYIDGSPDGSLAAGNSYASYVSPGIEINGAYQGGLASLYMTASEDEVRVSNIARSAGWIATEYNNQSAPTTFYTLGAETSSSHTNLIQGVSLINGVSSIN